jgi:dephospho-CoA kinase
VIKVGLTGGIGSGKSQVSRMLASHGAVVVDADQLARDVVAPGSEGLAAVVHAFGPAVLDRAGALDRPALAQLVFGDQVALRRLEAIVHPLVGQRADELIAAAAPGSVVVYDVPLLVEKGLEPGYDVVVVVDAAEGTRLERLAVRGMAEADARARMAAQASGEDRLAAADLVIRNDGTLTDLETEVAALWNDLLRRVSAGSVPPPT